MNVVGAGGRGKTEGPGKREVAGGSLTVGDGQAGGDNRPREARCEQAATGQKCRRGRADPRTEVGVKSRPRHQDLAGAVQEAGTPGEDGTYR